ncbi:MAG: VOC family protein [Pseudomonadota bacterium]|nr:VOC family protein [Pseudomonadota bacterium]
MPSPTTIARIDHVVLYVADLDAAAAFYETALGLVVERRLESPALAQLRAGEALLDLIRTPGDRTGPTPIHHVALGVDDADLGPLRDHLKDIGAEPDDIKTRYGALGFGPSFTFRDPDGNLVEIKGTDKEQQ